jgi:hypothetical protein
MTCRTIVLALLNLDVADCIAEVYDHSANVWRILPDGEVQGKTLGGSMVYLAESAPGHPLN